MLPLSLSSSLPKARINEIDIDAFARPSSMSRIWRFRCGCMKREREGTNSLENGRFIYVFGTEESGKKGVDMVGRSQGVSDGRGITGWRCESGISVLSMKASALTIC